MADNPDDSDDTEFETEPYIDRLFSLQRDLRLRLEDRFLTGRFNHTASNGTWRPSGYVGSGGDGVVGLWCEVDPSTNRIIDRIAIKQVTPGQARYDDHNHWKNGVIGGTPLEFDNGIRLFAELASSGRGLEKYITRALGFSTPNDEYYLYNLYFEYCAYGTVYNVVREQRAVTRKVMGLTIPTQVPEPFIWYFLESMVKVAVSMESIGMVHKDLQAGNVLFDNPDPHYFAMYPMPKMADFGNSRFRDPQSNTPLHRNQPWDGTCQPFAPPELHVQEDFSWTVLSARSPDHRWVTAKTNIWQIGMLALCLIRSQAPVRECFTEDDPKEQLNFATDSEDGMSTIKSGVHNYKDTFHQYSNQLYNLVDRMLEFQPADRPDPTQALQQITDVFSQNPALLKDMKAYVPSDDLSERKKHRQFLHIMSRANEYRIGKDFPGVRPR